jgi:large subunit ribosomal protein L25
MANIQLKADKREVFGKKVKSLRAKGLLPGNVFGKKIDSYAVQISYDDFSKVYKEAGETSLIELVVAGKKHPVLITNIQLHPVSGLPLHIDFHEVDLKEKVAASIPVEIVGESPVEKSGLGTVVLQLDEIEVQALPMDLPEKFEIDASHLTEVDQAVYVKDLNYDKNKIEIETDQDQIVAKVEPPQKEEAPAPVITTEPAEAQAPAPDSESKTTQAPKEAN